MIQIDLGTATRRQTVCSRHIYVVELSLSLRSTLDPQEVKVSNGLHFVSVESNGVAVSISFTVYGAKGRRLSFFTVYG